MNNSNRASQMMNVGATEVEKGSGPRELQRAAARVREIESALNDLVYIIEGPKPTLAGNQVGAPEPTYSIAEAIERVPAEIDAAASACSVAIDRIRMLLRL